jgi:hypothetical protein
MTDFYKELGSKYTEFTITHAIAAAKESAAKHKPQYYTGDDFEPHLWVVEAICWALKIGGIE